MPRGGFFGFVFWFFGRSGPSGPATPPNRVRTRVRACVRACPLRRPSQRASACERVRVPQRVAWHPRRPRGPRWTISLPGNASVFGAPRCPLSSFCRALFARAAAAAAAADLVPPSARQAAARGGADTRAAMRRGEADRTTWRRRAHVPARPRWAPERGRRRGAER